MDFSNLTQLHISACAALSDAVLASAVLALASSLRILDLARCHNLVRIASSAMEGCTVLEEIRASEMHGLEAVKIEGAARMRVVVLQRCWTLRAVRVSCPELERVSVVHCNYLFFSFSTSSFSVCFSFWR